MNEQQEIEKKQRILDTLLEYRERYFAQNPNESDFNDDKVRRSFNEKWSDFEKEFRASHIQDLKKIDSSGIILPKARPFMRRLDNKEYINLEKVIQDRYDSRLYFNEMPHGPMQLFRQRTSMRSPANDFLVFTFPPNAPEHYVLYKIYAIDTQR